MNLDNLDDHLELDDESLYQAIKQIIETSRAQAMMQVNQGLVLAYWSIGKFIKVEVLQNERSQYGESKIKQLGVRLTQEYGQGFSYSSLTRMAKLYMYLPDQEKVATLSQQLSWSHFVELIRVEDP
ncbi:MAG: DUF1016 domain-containing protein [Alkalinema sp. RU_4_3]|nr:DUF1016 domain-containing protein [Alkalinema sp. RU_4_3]